MVAMTAQSPKESKRHTESLIRHIQRTRKERTILISDIEHSTRFWSHHGDIQGRLMVDRHNWLLFPIIRQFKGRIVKTIGDSILAAFKDPDLALQAAIAIQQILERERQTNKNFTMKIRIGLHSGEALVEHNDVFGDVVNIASRLESRGKGGEILFSSETRKRLKNSDYTIAERGSFVPKGKSGAYDVYLCHWRRTTDLLPLVRLHTKLPLIRRQRIEVAAFAFSGLAAIWLMVQLYLRFMLSENETLALVFLDPGTFWWEYPLLVLSVLGLAGGIYYTVFILKSIPLPALRILKGFFGFLAFFLLAYGFLWLFPGAPGRYLRTPLAESDHLFMKSLVVNNPIYQSPSPDSRVLKHCQPGQLLLLANVKKIGPMVWNKVLIGPGRHGWIPRVLPPRLGIPAQRLTLTNKFYFRIRDLYALVIGLLGFVWGFFTFHVRPA